MNTPEIISKLMRSVPLNDEERVFVCNHLAGWAAMETDLEDEERRMQNYLHKVYQR